MILGFPARTMACWRYSGGIESTSIPLDGFLTPHPEERSEGSRLEGRGRVTRCLRPSFETAASPPPQDEVGVCLRPAKAEKFTAFRARMSGTSFRAGRDAEMRGTAMMLTALSIALLPAAAGAQE